MLTNVRVREIAVYHPESAVKSEYYKNHFEKQGRDISAFLDAMGKKDHFMANHEEESSLTMAIEASKKVLEKADLNGEDIDYIVFSSQVPERLFLRMLCLFMMPFKRDMIHLELIPMQIVQA